MLGNRDSQEDWDTQLLWNRYCGFLDLSLKGFKEIQNQLLLEQISLISESALGQELFPGKPPATIEQFRERVPLTCKATYKRFFEIRNEEPLPEKPDVWAHTSDDGGDFQWVPYTRRAFDRLIDYTVASAVLAMAQRKGDYLLPKKPKTLFNIPLRPYLTGLVAQGLFERNLFSPVIPIDKGEHMEFMEKMQMGFEEALETGVDVLGSKNSILVRMGESFAKPSEEKRRLPANFWKPVVASRLLRAVAKSKLQHRPMLPKDLWPVKAILCWGTDTDLYREKIAQYWGHPPFEFFATTEVGILAMQSWRKAAMTFVPDAAFLEFIPEEEWARSRREPSFSPRPLLIDQVESGRVYELVITSFYGMPFIRFRVGFLIRVTALEDTKAGISLPQITLVDRSDSIIDLAGFTRMGERSVLKALEEAQLAYNGWFIKKDRVNSHSELHLYIETLEEVESTEVANRVNAALMNTDPFYRDLNTMLGPHNISVTTLSPGTFQRYYEQKSCEGADLAKLRPARMNPPDTDIKEILRLSSAFSRN